jgi:hypothetical protein
MSVCTFGTEELANVAAVICNANPHRTSDAIHRACEALALVSQANIACFNDKYRSDQTPSTAKEIERAIMMRGFALKEDLPAAYSVAMLMHYNCDDEGGDFTLKIEGAAAALAQVLKGMMIAMAKKAGIER